MLSAWAQEHRVFIWIIPWFFSLLCGALGLGLIGYGYTGSFCLLVSDKLRLFINYIPRWAIIITILILYTRLYLILQRARKTISLAPAAKLENSTEPLGGTNPSNDLELAKPRLKNKKNISDQRLKRVMIQMMIYPLAYMIIFIIPSVIRIYQFSTGKAAPFWIGTIDKVCIICGVFAKYHANESTIELHCHTRFYGRYYIW